MELDPHFDESGSVPYTIDSDSDFSSSLSLDKDDSLKIVTEDEQSGLLTSDGQEAVKTKLQDEVKKQETIAQSG